MAFYGTGAACFIGAYALPAVCGFSTTDDRRDGLPVRRRDPLAFERIMKVWTQESFPTMLRSTAEGSVIAVARISSALVASVTPALLNLGPKLMHAVLARRGRHRDRLSGVFQDRTTTELDEDGHTESATERVAEPAAR
jgi:inositol transporter-like SP family MFS transporter